MNNPSVGGKRVQVDKDKAKVFALVSAAAVVLIASAVISKGIWSNAMYVSRVNDKKEKAVKQLKDNIESVNSLKTSYNDFKTKNPNLLGEDPAAANSPRAGDNATLILDALPSKYDFPAVASSVEKLISVDGFTINGIQGTDNILNQEPDAAGTVEMPFTFDVTSTYANFKVLVKSLNRSIRPIQITKVELSGSDSDLEIKVTAKSFYQAERGLEIKQETVK